MNANKSRLMLVSFVTAGALAVFAWGADALYAQDPDQAQDYSQKDEEKIFEDVAKDLQLTTEQKDQIRLLRQKQRNAAQKLRQRLGVVRSQMRQELEAQVTDQAKLSALIAETKGLLAELVDVRVEGILATKRLLSSEQFKALMQKTEELRSQRKKKGHREGGMRKKGSHAFLE